MYKKSPTEDLFKRQAELERIRSDAFHGVPQSHLHDLSANNAQQLGISQRNKESANVTAMPGWLALPLLGVVSAAALIFGIKLVSENIDIRPAADFTNAVNLNSDEQIQFSHTCVMNEDTRLLSQPGADMRSSRISIREGRVVGLLDYDSFNGNSRIVIKTDANAFQIFTGIEREYRHGYIPTHTIGGCEPVEGFNTENAYQINPNQGSRNRRGDETHTENGTTTPATPSRIDPPITFIPSTIVSCVIAENGVNIRANPMIRDGNIVTTVPFNAAVEHSGSIANVDWQRVELQNGQQGYIHRDYLQHSPNGLCPS